ncbi:MAG: metallophosphoesterase [Phenylobacterium sp.]|uniref:metallophosphoesterase family protein n=1 Tax=Phenylobacterium sp. TaxID=1871053 RepID=UPI00271EA2B1|nr:metallophosphoesterase [Phenylobacterium sp.]MDO8411749.1 metallophosphoesterase [Phenylobacterium sp.]
MPPFRLAHISDPHLPPPERSLGLRDLVSKRALSAMAWRRKGGQHDKAVLDALVADIGARTPDHIAITGDLTNFSTAREIAGAQAWLSGLGAPAHVTVSPGNHDALVGRPEADGFAPWRPWLADDQASAFPHVRIRRHVAIINLCSAVPTAPWLATGELGEAQLAQLAQLLPDLADRGLFRLIMLHHPPVVGVVSPRKSLEDGEGFRAILAAHGADLILHGHAHEAALGGLPGSTGLVPVLGVPSASATPGGRHPPARWHEIEIGSDGDDRQVWITARGLSALTGAFETLGRYRLVA